MAKEFPYGAKLTEVEAFTTSLKWPAPVDQRLDGLVKCATEAGERTTRTEIVAALVLAAEADGDVLSKQLKALRLGKVQDAVLTPHEGSEAKVLRLEPRKPGRKRM